MRILKKGLTPDGVKIQLEDWENGRFSVGAYPIAVNSFLYIQKNRTFRLDITALSEEDALQIFESLENGSKQFSDFKNRFWNGERDEFILGI